MIKLACGAVLSRYTINNSYNSHSSKQIRNILKGYIVLYIISKLYKTAQTYGYRVIVTSGLKLAGSNVKIGTLLKP